MTGPETLGGFKRLGDFEMSQSEDFCGSESQDLPDQQTRRVREGKIALSGWVGESIL